jgi:hypothetical protein
LGTVVTPEEQHHNEAEESRSGTPRSRWRLEFTSFMSGLIPIGLVLAYVAHATHTSYALSDSCEPSGVYDGICAKAWTWIDEQSFWERQLRFLKDETAREVGEPTRRAQLNAMMAAAESSSIPLRAERLRALVDDIQSEKFRTMMDEERRERTSGEAPSA